MAKDPATQLDADSARCPICELPSRECFVLDHIPIAECVQCHHRFATITPGPEHVAKHYGDDYFSSGGAGYDNYLDEASLLEAHGRRYAAIVSTYCDPPAHLLSIGAAAGFVDKGFASSGWRTTGIEPNDSMAEYARCTLGLDVRTTTLEGFESDECYDLVTAIQVMAHFVAPRAAAERIVHLTRPAGHILIETWNYRSLTARCFGRYWHEYSPPTVLHWFSPTSLDRLMLAVGARRVATGRPKKRLLGSHARSLLRYKLQSIPCGPWLTGATRLIPKRLAIPYPSEDLFWSLYKVAS